MLLSTPRRGLHPGPRHLLHGNDEKEKNDAGFAALCITLLEAVKEGKKTSTSMQFMQPPSSSLTLLTGWGGMGADTHLEIKKEKQNNQARQFLAPCAGGFEKTPLVASKGG